MLKYLLQPATHRMGARRIARTFKPFKKYSGNVMEAILKEAYQGDYLRVSAGHFKEFYVRDFGMCVEGLLFFKKYDIVLNTLEYALAIFKKHNTLTTTINSKKQPINFFNYGIDSLPFLLRSIRLAMENKETKKDAQKILNTYKSFIEEQTIYFMQYVREDGLLDPNKRVSIVKDHYNRPSSCYGNCMIGMLKTELNHLGLKNPLQKFDYKNLILQHFWTGTHFKDSLESENVTGDAQTFPFYCNIIDNQKILNQCIKTIQKLKLDDPLPIKYSTKKDKSAKLIWFLKLATPNYEVGRVVAHVGLCYLSILRKHHKKLLKTYLQSYHAIITKYQTFLENFDHDGSPYRSRWYVSDEGMSWIVMYEHLQVIAQEA